MPKQAPIPVVIVGAKPPSTDDLGRQIVVGVIAMLIVHALVNGGKKRR